MNECYAAWVAGFRLGHDGLPPAFSMTMLKHELATVELSSGDPPADAKSYDWFWHIMGWTSGQMVASYEMGKP